MSADKIGRYQISGELGKGAMGVVYKATDPTIGRTVALKTMRMDIHGEQHDDILRRFQNEARAAGLLSHPNIVTIYDAGESDGIFYIAMEYIEGESLAGLLAKKRSLSAQEVVELGNQMCAGLQYAHSKKVVHRDIKPANIMLAAGGVVKITDFGIAKAGASLTHTGEVVGTPHYMSPEQIKGYPLDGRSDLFSVGVVLYEMITGEKPFNGPAVTSVIYNIVHENPVPPREIDVSIHPGMSLVITKSLAKDPEDRYQDAADLSTALRSYKIINAPEDKAVAAPSKRQTTRVPTRPVAPLNGMSAPSSIGMKPASSIGLKKIPPKPAVESTVELPSRTSGSGIAKTILLVATLAALLLVSAVAIQKLREKSAAPVAQVVDPPAAAVPAPAGPPKPRQSVADKAAPEDEMAQGEGIETVLSKPEGVGDLRITSTPSGAQVTIDGVAQAWYVTPFNTPPMKAGTHTVIVTAAGLPAQTRSVDVVSRKKTVVDFQLAGENAIFNVGSAPAGAEITIDGQATGARTPAQFALRPGNHRITLALEGFEPEEFQANGSAGTEVNIAPRLRAHNSVNITADAQADTPTLAQFARMRRAIAVGDIPEGMGAVQVRTRPKGATVTVETRQLARLTPFRFPARPGSYTVTISKAGFQPVTRVLTVEEGKLLEVDELLMPQR
jgi:serine/threonine protein kinase